MGILTSMYHILNSENDTNKNFEELKHSKSYSDLLEEYVKSVRINIQLKNSLKYYSLS